MNVCCFLAFAVGGSVEMVADGMWVGSWCGYGGRFNFFDTCGDVSKEEGGERVAEGSIDCSLRCVGRSFNVIDCDGMLAERVIEIVDRLFDVCSGIFLCDGEMFRYFGLQEFDKPDGWIIIVVVGVKSE